MDEHVWNDLIEQVQRLLEQVRQSSDVRFVHVRGHIGEEGNERADRLVQWGKTEGPFSRLRTAGGGEGSGRFGPVDGHLRVETVADGLRKTLVLGQGDQDEFVQSVGENSDRGSPGDEGWDQLTTAVATTAGPGVAEAANEDSCVCECDVNLGLEAI